MLTRLLAFVALAVSFIPASFAQQGVAQGQGSVQGAGQIVVGPPAIPPTVTISPSVANLATNATQQFTATVLNDNFNQGVTWTLSGAGCTTAPATSTITFVGATDGGNNGGSTTSLTFATNVGSGANRLLLVNFVGDTTLDDVSSVTYAGQNMTLVGKTQAFGDRWNYLYYLLGPTAGSNNVVITVGTAHYIVAESATWTGVNQSGQPDAVVTNNSGSSTTTLTTVADKSMVALGVWDFPGISAGTGSTARVIESGFNSGGIFESSADPITPPRAVSMTINAGGNFAGIMASFAPATSGVSCGTLSQPISKTGVPITYTAPSSAPSPNLVTLTATSNLNPVPASSASVNITITEPPPPIAVRNQCIPGSQTTAATNTFGCQASLGNAVEVTVYDSTGTTVTGVKAGTVALTQVCSGATCVVNSGGVQIQKWYGIGLPAGITTYTVSNSPATSSMGIAVMDISNITALDTAAFTGGVTSPTTGPIGPTLTTTTADIIIPAIGVTGSTTGIAAPFTNVPGVVFGNGLAYTISPTAGTFNPNWTTTSGTWAGVTAAYVGGVPSPVISVSVAPTTASVKVNTTANFTPTVVNDMQGVNWTLTGAGCSGATCGTLSSSSTGSGVAVTYTAPSTVPSSPTVSLTAASITDPTKTASATITVTSNPIVVTVSPGSASVQQATGTQAFSCTVTNDAANAGCDWALSGAGCSGATCGGLSVSHTASGVTLTYTGPAAVPSPATVTLTASSTSDGSKVAAATITVTAAPVIVVSVSPGSASVQTTHVQAFSCTVTNDAGAAGCDWTLTGAGCSGATCGTLSTSHTASGVTLNYTGPSSVPSPATVTLTATSTTDGTKSAAATITVTSPPAIIVSVSPGSASVQVSTTKTFSCTVVNDAGSAGCDWALTGGGCSGATCGTLSTAHTASGVTLTYTAPGSVPSPATVTLTADSTTDPTKTAAATITVTAAPPPLTVSISPGTASVALGLTQAFTPTVVNDGSNLGVDWTLTGAGCSGATCGTLSTTHTASGVAVTYTAPAAVPSPATVIIHATSTTDNTKSATSTITVFAPAIVVSVSPGSASVQNGHTQAFTPTVTNDGTNAGVDWTLTGSGCSGATCGTLSSAHTASGSPTTYTAPVVVPSPATVTIHATSTADNTKSATATITVFSLAITVSVAPGTATVPVNATQAFTPTVTNDAANAGVDWTLSGSCTTFSENFSGGSLPVGWTATNATGVEGGGSFSPSHVSLSQGVLQLNVTQDGTTAGSVGAEVEYNQLFGYGTYSWSMQAAGTSATQGGSGSAVSGQISSTFQYSGGNPSPTEIDSPEIEGQFPNQIEWTTWLNGVRSDFHQTTLSNPQNTYHVYKYIWAPGSIAFYLDGSLIWTSTTNVPTAPAHPILNLWGTNSTSFGGVATAGVTRYMYVNNFTYSNCGSLSAAHTASGTPVTYTAPAIVPSPATVTITATSTTDNTKSAASTITVGTPPNITVTVAPSTASVTTGGVANFTATVSNDTSNLGVTWTLSGGGCSGATCGSVSPTASASGVAVTYTAPSSVPSPATVTITATSVTAPSKTATATITVTSPVVTVTVAPTTATLQAGGQTQSFTANVANGPAGVNWTLSGSTCTGSACGTVSPTTSLSGVAVTYTSPAANVAQTVTLTATSINDGTKTASATIHVNANTTQFSCAGVPCPAFPGAQGGGAASAGGRGGVVYNITTTADGTNAGCLPNSTTTCSLRDCVNATGARTCIFRLAGIFPVTAGDLRFGNPFLTVACQSAPGEVILGGPSTSGALFWAGTHDVIMRYCTLSPDTPNQVTGPDTGSVSITITNCSQPNGAPETFPYGTNTGCYNQIYDHVTTRWSGNKSWITGSNFTPDTNSPKCGTTPPGCNEGDGPNKNITVQWSLDYEPHEGHPVGFGTATDETCQGFPSPTGPCLSPLEVNIDFHHDMLVNVDHRIPENSNQSSRWINNIVYNWSTYANQWLGAETVDVINNKFIQGNLNSGNPGPGGCALAGCSGPAQAHPIHFTANSPPLCGIPSGYVSGNVYGPSGTNTINSNQWGNLTIAIAGEDAAAENSVLNPANEWCLRPVNDPRGGGGQTQTSGIPVPNAWQRTSPMAASNNWPIVPDPATSLDTILTPTVGNSQHLDCNGNQVAHRDGQDQRIIAEYQNGTIGGFWPNGVSYSGFIYCPPGSGAQCSSPTTGIPTPTAQWQDNPVTAGFPTCTETLHDGIPDQWKTRYGLSTSDATLYHTTSPTGLTYLEDYLDGVPPTSGGAAGTFTATSCSPAAVNAAIAAEQVNPVDGDIIAIPAGSCSWTTEVTATFANSVTIQGAGAISATTGGAGTTGSDLTAITDNSGTSSIMAFTTTLGKSLRVTGIALIGTSNAADAGILNINGSSSSVRVDHCHILTTAGAVGLRIDGSVLGVADHVYFQSPSGANPNNPMAMHNGINWNGSSEPAPAVGDHSWADTDHFGTSQFFFFEDDAFTQGDIGDAHDGARYVIRHSTYNGTHGQMYNHGLTDARGRSVRAAEIYLNNFKRTVQDGAPSFAINSGTLLYWGNTSTDYQFMVEQDYTRKDNSTYNYGTTPTGWGLCNGTTTSTAWDGTSPGYPCLDQAGRGAGNLLSGNFPSVINTRTGTIAFAQQALDPLYIWDNTFNDAGFSPEGYLAVGWSALFADNADYYQQFNATYGEPGSFDGTKGVGQGLLSARTATCTARVGYWATDTQTLYVCNPTNTWTTYYTAYTYPHPLTGIVYGLDINAIANFPPQITYQSLRLWDAGVTWKDIETSNGVFVWTLLDQWIAGSTGHDVLYTFGKVPTWAGGGASFNNPPTDIATGNATWKAFITALVTRYKGKIAFYEMWNEPNGAYWTGTPAQMEQMVADAAPIIRSIDPAATILSPSITDSLTASLSWMQSFIDAGGAALTDIWCWHTYPGGDVSGVINQATAYKGFLASNGQSAKQVWSTEGSKGGGWTSLSPADQVTFLTTMYADLQSQGIARFYWYAYDNTQGIGTLETSGIVNPAGQAYSSLAAAAQ